MKTTLLPIAVAVAMAGGSIIAFPHDGVVKRGTVIVADSGGGDGGMERRTIETADSGGGGDGGFDRRATEQA